MADTAAVKLVQYLILRLSLDSLDGLDQNKLSNVRKWSTGSKLDASSNQPVRPNITASDAKEESLDKSYANPVWTRDVASKRETQRPCLPCAKKKVGYTPLKLMWTICYHKTSNLPIIEQECVTYRWRNEESAEFVAHLFSPSTSANVCWQPQGHTKLIIQTWVIDQK